MKALITGINGFIGTFLAQHLLEKGFEVAGTSQQKNTNKTYRVYSCDLLNYAEVSKVVLDFKPDYLFHLAAQSSIPYSFKKPQETIDTNINGSLNILETLRQNRLEPIFISVGSSSEYGQTGTGDHSLSEEAVTKPMSPYAVSKLAQGHLVELYKTAYGLEATHVRPFTIVGPGKKGDAISDFARGIVEIEKGKSKSLLVGNLSHTRDFLDVRDAVVALVLIAQNSSFPIYNICSGKGIKIEDILTQLIKLGSVKVRVETDSKKTRPADDHIIVGDPERLNSLGFKSKYSIEQTLSDILEFWRTKI